MPCPLSEGGAPKGRGECSSPRSTLPQSRLTPCQPPQRGAKAILYHFTILEEKSNHHLTIGWNAILGGVTMKEKKEEKIISDPFGSYTGLVKEPYEKPVQDADDL